MGSDDCGVDGVIKLVMVVMRLMWWRRFVVLAIQLTLSKNDHYALRKCMLSRRAEGTSVLASEVHEILVLVVCCVNPLFFLISTTTFL
jgi:hypothetical protein